MNRAGSGDPAYSSRGPSLSVLYWLHRQRITQRQFGQFASRQFGELDRVIWIAEKNLIFFANNEDEHFLEHKIFLCDTPHVFFANGFDSRAKFLPELGVFGVAAREFILCKSIGHLPFGGERAREPVDETTF